MRLDKKVFILGAGASKPYGYPTAGELREKIIRDSQEILRFAYEIVEPALKDFDTWYFSFFDIIQKFRESNTESIDLFLTRNKQKIDTDLAIQLILCALIYYERSVPASQFDKDWYFAFYNELTREITEKKQLYDLLKEPIQFITFNYDRSLEHFLFSSLRSSFSLDTIEAVTIYHKLFNVYHIYGKIADLEWESRNGIAYASDMLYNNIIYLAGNIKLIYDDRIQVEEKISDRIKNANKIYVLGFGFAKPNVEKLDLPNLLHKDQILYATGLNLFDNRVEQIKKLLWYQKRLFSAIISIEQKLNCLELLKKYLF